MALENVRKVAESVCVGERQANMPTRNSVAERRTPTLRKETPPHMTVREELLCFHMQPRTVLLCCCS